MVIVILYGAIVHKVTLCYPFILDIFAFINLVKSPIIKSEITLDYMTTTEKAISSLSM